MTYATRSDLERRFGQRQIADLADDPDADAVDRTATALADADAEINAAIAVAYDLPLPRACPLLTAIACDLARGQLYTDGELKEPRRRAAAARENLARIREREIFLVDADDAPFEPRDGTDTVSVDAPAPAMDAAGLAGYGGSPGGVGTAQT